MNLAKRVTTLEQIYNPTRKTAIPQSFKDFNHLFGLLTSPITKKESQLLPYQIEIAETNGSIIVNKSRKIGVSETILRILAHRAFFDYAGHDIMIVAQREPQAKKLMSRLQGSDIQYSGQMFDNPLLRDYVVKKNELELVLSNGTHFWAFPSTASSFRGPDRVKAIFLDEAAHFDILEDEKIYTALSPNLINTKGDMFIVSTPNGRRGFFHRLYAESSDFTKFTLPYTVALGALIDQKEIDQERRNNLLFEQEYGCQFLSTRSAAFPPRTFTPDTLDDYEMITL